MRTGASSSREAGSLFGCRRSARSISPRTWSMGVRPEDLDGPSPSTEDTIAAKVSVKEQLGHSLLVYGDVDGTQIVASLDPHRQVAIDEEIRLKANVKAIHVFHPETLETLI